MAPALRRSLLALSVLSVLVSGCLDESLIKVPELVINPGVPDGWSGTAATAAIGTTPTDRRSGTTSAYLSNAFSNGLNAYTLVQSVRADDYRGKRVRLSAWMRPRNVSNVVNSGLWMRVDGYNTTLQFDNMNRRPVMGYGDWREVSVVLDVPQNAVGIAFGALFQATNTLLVDDMKFTVVDSTVASTNLLATPSASGRDSATTVAAYERSASSPRNLDFEGISGFSSTTAAWITGNASTLTTTDPTASLDDLEPLRAIVGTASVVGLGEATHGTKEFALLKDRMVRFLVTRMGFTTFSIEATSPEADELNLYLQTGVGDPAKLLSHLYFWTWNTREVANMIAWMRQWNSTAPANQRVQFRGFDMQYPGASIDSVKAYVHRNLPSFDADIAGNYQCLAPYRNTGSVAGRPASEYLALAAEPRQLCNEALTEAYETVRKTNSALPGYQATLHHARLVQQFETRLAATSLALSSRARDAAMAENIAWIKDQPAAGKIIVWAHNDHISRQNNQMGGFLNATFGAEYRAVAFAFGTGKFSAVKQTDETFGAIITNETLLVPPQSIEDAFMGTNTPLLLLDMRKTTGIDPAGRVLRGPIAMRSIGCCFDVSKENQYFGQLRLFPSDYDALVFVRDGTASTLLPFIN